MTPIAARFLEDIQRALARGVPLGQVLAQISDGLVPGWVDMAEMSMWADDLATLPGGCEDVPSPYTVKLYAASGLDVFTGLPV